MRRFVVPDVREMSLARFADVDDAACRPDGASKFCSGALRVPCRAEARHDDGDEIGARELEPIERRRRAKKRKRGIRAARDADDELFGMRAFHAPRKRRRLDRENAAVPVGFPEFV